MYIWEVIEEKAEEVKKMNWGEKLAWWAQYDEEHGSKSRTIEELLDDFDNWEKCEKIAEMILEEEAQKQWEKMLDTDYIDDKDEMIRLMDNDWYWINQCGGGDNWELRYWDGILEQRTAKREFLTQRYADPEDLDEAEKDDEE